MNNGSLKAAAATAALGRKEADVRAELATRTRQDARTYAIEMRRRGDGVETFFFKVDGEVRRSSYDRKDISDFALGYAGREVEIVEVAS